MRPLAQLEQLSRVAMAQGHSWEDGVGDSMSDPRMTEEMYKLWLKLCQAQVKLKLELCFCRIY